MTAFETELVNAIRHGCPFCGSKSLVLKQVRLYDTFPSVPSVRSPVFHNYQEYCLSHEQEPQMVETQDKMLFCPEPCATLLWDKNWGWIPELADIVKGE